MQTRSQSSKSPNTSDDGKEVSKGKAHWTLNKERELINFLSEFKGEMSSNPFKDTVFQQASLHI
jgi:hypothetical protein